MMISVGLHGLVSTGCYYDSDKDCRIDEHKHHTRLLKNEVDYPV